MTTPTSTITAQELARPPRRPVADDRRRPAARGLQRLAPRATRRAAATSPAPSRSRSTGSGRVDEPEIERLLAGKGVAPDRDVVVYGDGVDDAAHASPTRSTRFGIAGVRVLRRRVRGVGRGSRRCRSRQLPKYEQARPHRLAAPGAGGRAPEAAPDRRLPAVPRQLRRPRGVRGGAHPGRPLPRHELARGPGRLEPPLARGARRGAPRARHHQGHDGRRLRPRHRGRREREVARSTRRPDRGDAGADDPALRRRRRRPPARRRLRLVGPRRQPGRDDACASRRRSPTSGGRSRSGPRSSSTSTRPSRSSPTPTARPS